MEEGFKACPYCAKPIREAATVCRFCNRALSETSPATAAAPVARTRSSLREVHIVAISAATVAALLLAGFYYRNKPSGSTPTPSTTNSSAVPAPTTAPSSANNTAQPIPPLATVTQEAAAPPPASPPPPPPRPVIVPLLNGNLEVGPGQIRWFNFTVPASATEAAVVGEFHAFGGRGNDIQVILTTPFELENWKNGHEAQLFYNSGQVTNAMISVPNLPAGQYVLAFDNRFSVRSRKEVTGKIAFGYRVP